MRVNNANNESKVLRANKRIKKQAEYDQIVKEGMTDEEREKFRRHPYWWTKERKNEY